MKKLTIVAAVLSALSCSAQADSNWYASFGAANVSPNDSSSSLNVIESVAKLPANSTEAAVDSNTQLGLTLGYRFNPQWSVELLAATPFSHDVSVKGSAIDGLAIGDVKHLPPTLTAKYHFNFDNSDWSAFLGAGINYTLFFEDKPSSALVGTLQKLNVTKASDKVDLKLSNSWGLALQAGVNYKLNQDWSLRGNVWWIDIDTDAEVRVNGKSIQDVDVSIDPIVYYVGLEYQF